MNCPYCKGDSRVVDSRPSPDTIRRRRECINCRRRFTSYERLEPPEIKVLKRGSRAAEEFSLEKLVTVLRRICRGCSVPEAKIEDVARTIEAEIVDRKGGVIKSLEIAKIVTEHLDKLGTIVVERFTINYVDEQGRSQLDAVETREVRKPKVASDQYLLFDVNRDEVK